MNYEFGVGDVCTFPLNPEDPDGPKGQGAITGLYAVGMMELSAQLQRDLNLGPSRRYTLVPCFADDPNLALVSVASEYGIHYTVPWDLLWIKPCSPAPSVGQSFAAAYAESVQSGQHASAAIHSDNQPEIFAKVSYPPSTHARLHARLWVADCRERARRYSREGA